MIFVTILGCPNQLRTDVDAKCANFEANRKQMRNENVFFQPLEVRWVETNYHRHPIFPRSSSFPSPLQLVKSVFVTGNHYTKFNSELLHVGRTRSILPFREPVNSHSIYLKREEKSIKAMLSIEKAESVCVLVNQSVKKVINITPKKNEEKELERGRKKKVS